jgi:hypothetical protein
VDEHVSTALSVETKSEEDSPDFKMIGADEEQAGKVQREQDI